MLLNFRFSWTKKSVQALLFLMELSVLQVVKEPDLKGNKTCRIPLFLLAVILFDSLVAGVIFFVFTEDSAVERKSCVRVRNPPGGKSAGFW